VVVVVVVALHPCSSQYLERLQLFVTVRSKKVE